MLSGFFPLDEATSKDWRFGKLCDAQRRNLSATATVYSWYKRSCTHLTAAVVELLDAMLAIDPQRRIGMQQIFEHPWTRGPEAIAAAAAAAGGVGEKLATREGVLDDAMETDGPKYRAAVFDGPGVEELLALDDGDADGQPVYRSLAGADFGDEVAPPIPMLGRQKAFSRLWS
jgi:hypothetical protein